MDEHSHDEDRERIEQAVLEAQAEQAERARHRQESPRDQVDPASNPAPRFASLVTLCTPALERAVRQVVRSVDARITVADVVQQTWMTVAERLEHYQSEQSGFLAWLTTIGRNLAKNALRDATALRRGGRANRRSADDSDLVRRAMDTATSVFSRTSKKEEIARLTSGLRRCLPRLLEGNRDQAEVITRRHFGSDARTTIAALESGRSLLDEAPAKQPDFRQIAESMAAAGSKERDERACDALYRRAMVSLGLCLLRNGAALDRPE